jgi:transposase
MDPRGGQPPVRLRREEIVTIEVLAEHGESGRSIARRLGVSEGTVRYHLRRQGEERSDGRKDKPFLAEAVEEVIAGWFGERRDAKRPVNVIELYEHLVAEYQYGGSYRSVLRFVRARYPRPRLRTFRRVETPPGAQTQTDWAEYPAVDLGSGPEPLSGFVMVLSHSRKPAMVWSRGKDLLAWLDCHNAAYRRLAGVAAVNRVDNVKTAVVRGAGAWGEIHPAYRAYAQTVGFHIEACEPGEGRAKGKVEAKVRLSRLRLDPGRRRWDGLEELQAVTDARITAWATRAMCPATGKTVEESWHRELGQLAALPLLPEPFDVAVTRPVHADSTVRFENRTYAVPFALAGQRVEVRGCAGRVQVLAHGQVVVEYPRRSEERILLDPRCYEGEATERVLPPKPLGRMGRRLQEILEMPVELRPVDLYAACAEVAR